MKIFEMNDCDWWVGESLESCIAEYQNSIDDDPGAVEFAREVKDEELDKLTFVDDDGAVVVKRSFREQLAIEISNGGKFPRLFASTEAY